ncbi:BTAD domain-containing putative transcriptional regulator [Embleya sp. NPDC050493]|uniref:AfsR/SARP family transcriptional regulator n=1 Tax=Embleya sp. NPDC050493 TaxID=3363989 RepID=UPI0037987418
MSFQVLGPTRVSGPDGSELNIGPRRQRELLTLLLLRPGVAVPVDRLAEELWNGRPPPGARSTLHAYLSGLRRVLEPGRRAPYRVLTTRDDSYALEVPAGQLDTARWHALAEAGRAAVAAGALDRADELLRAALALWVGDAFAELADHDVAQAERARLAEEHTGLLEEAAECRLALGAHASVIGDLMALVREHPLRERPRAQLALALYRSGRQAEALAVLEAGRRLCAEELGLDPGPGLRELQAAILRQDPALATPERRPAASVCRGRRGVVVGRLRVPCSHRDVSHRRW